MNLFTNSEFLKNRDAFYSSKLNEDYPFKPGDVYELFKGNFNKIHNFQKRSNFSPLFNSKTVVIEYVEKDPMNLNLFGMPVSIRNYNIFPSQTSKNDFSTVFIESKNDFPMFLEHCYHSIIIQETNTICSVLVQQPEYKKINEIEFKVLILSLFKLDGSKSSPCFITTPNHIFLSGHIQPKIETGVTLPKQEFGFIKNIRNEIEKNIQTMLMKKVFNSRKKTKHKKGIYKKNLFKSRKIEKKLEQKNIESKKESIQKIYDYVSTNIDFIQIKSVREFYIRKEIFRFQKFFQNLFKYGNFSDINNVITILYTLSCFPLNDHEVTSILQKIEIFLNECYFIKSVNFFNSINTSKLGKQFFLTKFLNVFREYFEMEELDEIDKRLEIYLKEFGKENYILDIPENSEYLLNIEKKKKGFIETKKRLIQLIYFLEYEYLMEFISGNSYCKFNKEKFYKSIDKFLPRLNEQMTDLEVDIDLYEVLMRDDEIKDFNYDSSKIGIKNLKNSHIYKLLLKTKEKNKKKKLKNDKTRRKQIRYSNIFFDDSPYSWKLHPCFKDKISNPFGVFLNYKNKV